MRDSSGARASRRAGSSVGGDAVLGLFVAEFDLEEDGEFLVERGGGGVEAGGDLEGVDGVDGVEELGGAGGLVGLERADEVVLSVGERCDGGEFLRELLNAVFAEEAQAGGVGFEDGFGGMHLADGHEGDFGLGAVGEAAGEGDLFADAG